MPLRPAFALPSPAATPARSAASDELNAWLKAQRISRYHPLLTLLPALLPAAVPPHVIRLVVEYSLQLCVVMGDYGCLRVLRVNGALDCGRAQCAQHTLTDERWSGLFVHAQPLRGLPIVCAFVGSRGASADCSSDEFGFFDLAPQPHVTADGAHSYYFAPALSQELQTDMRWISPLDERSVVLSVGEEIGFWEFDNRRCVLWLCCCGLCCVLSCVLSCVLPMCGRDRSGLSAD